MRTNLKLLRVKVGLSQEEMSNKIGCSRATYSAIEKGARTGGCKFWEQLQQAFFIPSSEMWDLMRNE